MPQRNARTTAPTEQPWCLLSKATPLRVRIRSCSLLVRSPVPSCLVSPERHFLAQAAPCASDLCQVHSRRETGQLKGPPARRARRRPNIEWDNTMSYASGRHFLQIPGPTNVPDRVLRAIGAADDRPSRRRVRGARARGARGHAARSSRRAARWSSIPSSGTGAWEAALVNTLSPGDRVLMFETGHFATLWRDDGRRGSGSRSTSCRATGATASIPAAVEASCGDDREHAHQGRAASCTTRRRPA